MKRALLFLFVGITNLLAAQNAVQFSSPADNNWVIGTNWSTGIRPGAADIAVFGLRPSGNGSSDGCVINFNDPSFPGKELAVGAIRVLPVRLQDLNIGNVSPSMDGTLTMNGVSLYGSSNVVVDNQMLANALHIKDGIVGNSRVLRVAFGAEAVFYGTPGSTTKISTQVAAAGNIIVRGGTLQVSRPLGATLPATTNIKVMSGALRISSNQSIRDLDLAVGTTLYIDDNVTLTVNGNFYQRGGIIIKSGTGKLDYTAVGVLEYVGSAAQTVGSTEWPVKGGPSDVIIDNKLGVFITGDRSVSGTLTVNGLLAPGINKIAAGNLVVNSGGVVKLASESTEGAFAGNFGTAKVTLKEGSWVEYNGLGPQYLSGLEYHNLFINNQGLGLKLAGDATVKGELKVDGLLIFNGATKIDLAGKALTLGGTVNGLISYRGSAESGLNIAAKQSIGTLNFDQDADGTSNALANLTISSGSAVLGSKLHLFTGLNIAGGSLDLANKNLVLKSNVQKTAYVAEVKGTLTGETNVTVERFSPAWSTRRYRLVTTPLLNTSINDAWQEGAKWNGVGTPVSSGYGTLITGQAQGSAATANKNGFDYWSAIAGASASVRAYVSASSSSQANWQGVASTITPGAFDEHQAYLLFIRGDRTIYTGTAAGASTLRGTGKLKKGTFTVSVPTKQTHTLIGNPYASPLDFKMVYDANNTKIQPYFWIWQSSLGTGTGGYALVRPVSTGSSLYEVIPGNGSKSTANRLIHSGEGFFVVPATGATTGNAITLQETHKSITTPTVSVFRQLGTEEPAKVYVNMLTDGASENILLDGVMAQYTDNGTMSGVGKSQNATENLSILKNGSDLIITSNVFTGSPDTLQLRMWNTVNRAYRLELRSENFGSVGTVPVLWDRYLKTETQLTQGGELTVYPFSVTTDAASKDPQRFAIAFKTNITLPLVITTITADAKTAGNVTVQWRAADETGIRSYQVERSFDGASFTAIGTLPARAGTGDQSYVYLDSQASLLNYYRIRMIGTQGEVKFSAVVKVQTQKTADGLHLYPNPVTGAMFNLQFLNKQKGTYTLNLYTISGQLVMSKTIQYGGGYAAEPISLNEAVRPGNYKLEVKNEMGSKDYLNISVQK